MLETALSLKRQKVTITLNFFKTSITSPLVADDLIAVVKIL